MSTARDKSKPDPRQLSFPWELEPGPIISSPEELGRAWLLELSRRAQKETRPPTPPRSSRPGTDSTKAKRPAHGARRAPSSARSKGGPKLLHEASAST